MAPQFTAHSFSGARLRDYPPTPPALAQGTSALAPRLRPPSTDLSEPLAVGGVKSTGPVRAPGSANSDTAMDGRLRQSIRGQLVTINGDRSGLATHVSRTTRGQSSAPRTPLQDSKDSASRSLRDRFKSGARLVAFYGLVRNSYTSSNWSRSYG